MPLSAIQARMLKRLLEVGSPDNIRKSLEKLHPSDIAELFSELPPAETSRLVENLFSIKKAGKILREMPEYFLPEILPTIENQKLSLMLKNLEPDDALFLLGHVDDERKKELLALIPTPDRDNLEQLILYPRDSAGSIMNVNIITLRDSMTAGQAIEHLRENREQMRIYYLYVVGETRQLCGILHIRDLLFADAGTKITDIMTREVLVVEPTVDKEKVAEMFAKYNLLGMPVVDQNRTLLGVITVDDVIDIVKEEATEDMYYMAGLSEADRAFSPLRESVRRRLPWTGVNVATSLIAATVIGIFQHSIVKAVSLAVFMPIVAQLAGNVGIQALTVITRSIALGELEFATAGKAILKEMGTGLSIGAIVGTVVGIACYIWTGNIYLGGVLFTAMILTMVISGSFGAIIPLTLRALKFDPALGSGIIVTAVSDTMSFVIFLGLGTMLLRYLAI